MYTSINGKLKITSNLSNLGFIFSVFASSYICMHLYIIEITENTTHICSEYVGSSSQRFVQPVVQSEKIQSAQKCRVLFCGLVVTKSFAIATSLGLKYSLLFFFLKRLCDMCISLLF